MASVWPVKVEFDCPEPRIDLGRLVVSADGTSWDMGLSDDTIFADPATGTAMLAPLCFRPSWATTFTGDYYRYHKTDYTLTTAASWKENHIRGLGDVFLEGAGVNEVVTVTTAHAANTPVFVSAYIPGIASTDTFVVLECGWNRGAADELTVRLMGNGEVQVQKGTAIVGRYNRREPQLFSGRAAGTAKAVKQTFASFCLLPCRKRDLLIVTDWGQSFAHTFEDLDSESSTNTITPAGQFYWYVPAGKPSVQAAVVHFETAGTLIGPPVQMRYAPPALTTFTSIGAADPVGPTTATTSATLSLVEEDGSTAFTPDGALYVARVKIALTGDGDGTIGYYAADLYCDPTTTTTVDDPVDVTCALETLTLSVEETGRTTCRMSARRKNLTDAGVDRPQLTANRPFRVALLDDATPTPGEIDLVRGVLNPPSIDYLERDTSASHDWSLLTFDGQDRMAVPERMMLFTYPYDGLALDDVVADLVTLAGWGAEVQNIESTAFTLPYSPTVSSGEWGFVPDRGDTVAQWLDKMRADFAASWLMAWVPTTAGYAFWFLDPGSFTNTPAMTLYQSTAAAISAGVSSALAPARIVRRLAAHYERPEANQVQVVGQDARTRLLIYGTYNDDASQDAGLAVASRPENWLGMVETVIHTDPALSTQEAVGRAGLLLSDRLMPGRVLIEWDSDLLVDATDDRPLWLGDVVRIMEPDGTTVKGDYRIVAIPQIEFLREDDGGAFALRRARYRGQLVREQSLDFSDPENSSLLAALV